MTPDAPELARLGRLDVDPRTLARLGLVLLAATIPLQRAAIIGTLGSIVSLIAVLVVPLALWVAWTAPGPRTWSSPPMALAVALSWWAGVTYFWSVDPGVTSGSFFRLLPIIATAVAYAGLSWDSALRLRLLRAYALGCAVASSLVIWQFQTTPAAQRFSVSPDASINQVAFTLVLGLVPAAYLVALALRANTMAQDSRSRTRDLVVYGSCYSVITTGVLLSGSRSGALLTVLATLVAVVLVVSAARNPLSAVKGMAALLLLAFALSVALQVTDAPPFERLVSHNGGLEEEARTEIASHAWTLTADQPIVGAGLGTGVRVSAPGYGEVVRNSHNTHMQVFLELGAVGAILWLLLVAAVFRAAWERPPLERLMWLAQLAVIFIGVGARGFVFGVPMWFFLGMVSARHQDP